MPSKLEQLQQQYRRQLLQEKEERMIKIHTESQQKALSKVSRYNGLTSVPTVHHQAPVAAPHHSPVKKGSPGVDRSRPLPPITRERSNGFNRTSPVSAPTDSVSKIANISSRSKSVDLVDSRQSPPRVIASESNGANNAAERNGYAVKVPEPEPPKPAQLVEQERRPDPETLARLKQAELQRLRSKAREVTPPPRKETPPPRKETPPPRSNGFTGAISKSSTVPKKTPAAPRPQPASNSNSTPRSRPSAQGMTVAASRKAVAASAPRKPAGGRSTSQAAAPTRQRQQQPAPGRKPPGPGQEQCRVCGRNFNADRIEKHVSICSKAAQKKVKVFDATKMRVQGTEAEQFVRKGLPKTEPPAKPKVNWRKQHNEFLEAIRQAKMVQQHLAKGGKVSDLPPPPPSDTSDYVPCPYCGRKFSQGVAERHIPKCKNIVSNKKNPVPRRK